MKIFNFKDQFDNQAPTVVTIGNFDGIHHGHRALIHRVVEESRRLNAQSALVTFDPHPQEVVHPGQHVPRICTRPHTIQLLEAEGLDRVHIISFTKEFSQLSPEDFAKQFLIDKFKLAKVVIGYDFCFGKARAGNADTLRDMSQGFNFEVESIQKVSRDGQTVSSSLIRDLIQQTRFEEIPTFLGRPYSIYEKVVYGEQRGRKLGFNTANFLPSIHLPLPFGVYVTKVLLQDRELYGVTNVGIRPTFGVNDPTVETHILDFAEDIYDQMIEVLPLKKLRDERKFNGFDELKSQIAMDKQLAVQHVKSLL